MKLAFATAIFFSFLFHDGTADSGKKAALRGFPQDSETTKTFTDGSSIIPVDSDNVASDRAHHRRLDARFIINQLTGEYLTISEEQGYFMVVPKKRDSSDASQSWTISPLNQLMSNGKCISLMGAACVPGNFIHMWECGDVFHEKWSFQPDGTITHPYCNNNDLVLAKGPNGNLVLANNDGSNGMKWTDTAPQIIPSGFVSNQGTRFIINQGNGLYFSVPDQQQGSQMIIPMAHDPTDLSQIWELTTAGLLKTKGKCISLVGDACQAGNYVHMWTCADDAAHEQWTFEPDGTITHPTCNNKNLVLAIGPSGNIILTNKDPSKAMKWFNYEPPAVTLNRFIINQGNRYYLGINGMQGANGSPTIAGPYDPTNLSQMWVITSFDQLMSQGKCISLYGDACQAGNFVHMWDCANDAAHEKWTFEPDGSITHPGCNNKNLVLAIGPNDNIILANSDSTTAMRWINTETAPLLTSVIKSNVAINIVNQFHGKYLAIDGMQGVDYKSVLAKSFDRTDASQTWAFTTFSQLKSQGKCISLVGMVCQSGTRVHMWDCVTGAPHEFWAFESDGTITQPACNNKNLVLAEGPDGSLILSDRTLANPDQINAMKWNRPEVNPTVFFQSRANGKVLDASLQIVVDGDETQVVAFQPKCTANQNWVVPSNRMSTTGFLIKSRKDPSRCLALDNFRCEVGEKVVLATCVDYPQMMWTYGSDGAIRNVWCSKPNEIYPSITQDFVLAEASDGSIIQTVNDKSLSMYWDMRLKEACPSNLDQGFHPEFCWRDTHTRGGVTLPTTCNVNTTKIFKVLCFNNDLKCPDGYQRFGYDCHQKCPPNFDDRGMMCQSAGPFVYFPTPYAWQWGDKAFSASGQFQRCGRDNGGEANCRIEGLLVYPNCGPNYKTYGYYCMKQPVVCRLVGMLESLTNSDVCYKKVVSALTGLACLPDQGDNSLGLCYTEPCAPGFNGVGPVCWKQPPKGYVECGMGAAKSVETCMTVSYNQGDAVGNVVLKIIQVATAFATGGASVALSGVTFVQLIEGFRTMALKGMFDSAMKAYRNSGPAAWLDFNNAGASTTPADQVRYAAQILAVIDITGVAAVVDAFSYPMCSDLI